jgi:hypothetical protein
MGAPDPNFTKVMEELTEFIETAAGKNKVSEAAVVSRKAQNGANGGRWCCISKLS